MNSVFHIFGIQGFFKWSKYIYIKTFWKFKVGISLALYKVRKAQKEMYELFKNEVLEVKDRATVMVRVRTC